MARYRLLFGLLSINFLSTSIFASNCGQSTIPFSFEALPDGQPVLGCARPTCFGWNPDGSPADKPATFYRINKKPDGYFRQAANIKPRAVNAEEAPGFHSQTAECAASFESDHCPNENQWIGGIGPSLNVSKEPRPMLFVSASIVVRRPWSGYCQIVIGGEILKEGADRQYAFDYISDVVKHQGEDGTVSYEVAIRRLPCLPYPNEFVVPIESTVAGEIIERFTKAEEKLKKNESKAFEATLSEVAVEGNAVEGAGEAAAAAPAGGGDGLIEGPFVAEGDLTQVVNSVDGYNGGPPPYQAGGAVGGSYQGAPASGYAVGYGAGGGGAYCSEPECNCNGGNCGGGSCRSEAGCSCVGAGCQCGSGGCGCQGGGCNCNGNGCGAQVYVVPQGGQGQGGPVVYQTGYLPGYGPRGSAFYCFSADTLVETSNGMKRMDELDIDDWVLSANSEEILFTKIESWIHRLPQQKAEFLKIELGDGKTLKITEKHFIYKTECTAIDQTVSFADLAKKEAVFAEKVQVGDCLYVLPDKDARNFVQKRVKSIEMIEEVGIFAPMTGNTDIIVNDIYASCYNVIYNKEMQRTFFRSMKFWRMPSLKSLIGLEEDEEEVPFGMGGMEWMIELMQYAIPSGVFSAIGS